MRTLALLLTVLLAGAAAAQEGLAALTDAWRTDPVWYDGQAEIAIYDATRNVYGQPRAYTATFMTNKERMSPQTMTKSASDEGVEVFKFHQREDIPTDAYTYHYSTMCYLGTGDDLPAMKLDMGSQEDCGATMKRMVRVGDHLRWNQYSYFPGEGVREVAVAAAGDIVLADALPLVLRGYPFDDPRTLTLRIIPDQTTNKWSPVEPTPATVSYTGRETLDLPIGPTPAHHVRVTGKAIGTLDYWFAADPATQHAMVAFEGPGGQTYRLRRLQRDAYWE